MSNSLQLTTPAGDIVPLPTIILWGGNGQLSADPTKLQIGGITYTYATGPLAQADYLAASTALKNWNGTSPINLKAAAPANPMTIASVSAPSPLIPGAGQVLTVTGTNLFDTSIQAFVGTAVATVQFVSPTTLMLTLPANSAGVFDLTLYRGPGDSVVSSGAITYSVALVPAMTGYTTPSGTVTKSDDSAEAAWHAFSGNSGQHWLAASAPQWIQYQFAAGKTITGYAFTNFSSTYTATFNLQGSNDGSTWTTLDSGTIGSAAYSNSIAPASYSYYRINVSASSYTYVELSSVQIYGH